MLRILGVLDLIAALMFGVLYLFDFSVLGWIFAIYLIVKGILFFNWFGFFDVVSGILMVLAVYDNFSFVTYFAVLWLLQKGIFSLL